MSIPRSLLVLGAVLVAALPALAQFGPASVFVDTVKPREFSMEIEAIGTLEPRERVELTVNVADRVSAVYFDDGQRVREGKTLLSLAQQEQRAEVEGAEATVSEARSLVERMRPLVADGVVSESQFEQSQRDLDVALSQLATVQVRLANRVLVAPFDGVLGFRRVSVGSYVTPGDVVATLIDDSQMHLDFSVPSVALATLEIGLEVEAETDALPGRRFRGVVASIDNAVDVVSRSVRVRATLPNPERRLKAGMFMNVTLKAAPRTSLSIPEEAVQPIGPRFYVFVAEPGPDGPVARQRRIELGVRQAGVVEVVSGLDAGEQVITEGVIRARDGAPVVIREKDILTPAPGGGGPATADAAPLSRSGLQ